MNVTKLIRGILYGFFMLIAPLTVSGCLLAAFVGDPAPPPKAHSEPKPIQVKKSEPIGFHKLLFRIPRGKEVFFRYNEYGRCYSKVKWDQGIMAGGYEERELINDELRILGYNVLGTENILFDEDQIAKARFQLGGVVEDAVFNYFFQFPSSRNEYMLTINWQLRDTFRKEVVYTKKTEGYYSYLESSTQTKQAVLEVIRDSLRRLLEDEKFVKIVTSTQGSAKIPDTAKSRTLTIQNDTPRSHKKREIQELMDGVVVIRVGNVHAAGFFISEDGYILTASHVVSNVEKVNIKTKAGQDLEARVVRIDKAQDVALIKVPGEGYPALLVETKKQPAMGSELYAIGSPLSTELSFSVTRGIVSGHREINGFRYIQTDASLNMGNSGGPMLDKDGKVVGIVSWKISVPGVEGLAFGVPTNLIASRLNLCWGQPKK